MDAIHFSADSPGRLVPAFDGSSACVPNPVPRELSLSIDTWRRVVAAERSVGALQGALAGLAHEQVHPTLLLGALLRREAIVRVRSQSKFSPLFQPRPLRA